MNRFIGKLIARYPIFKNVELNASLGTERREEVRSYHTPSGYEADTEGQTEEEDVTDKFIEPVFNPQAASQERQDQVQSILSTGPVQDNAVATPQSTTKKEK